VECALETTTFRGDDDPRLVRAALSCSACLSGEVDWTLGLDEWDAQVDCACRSCGHRRVVALSPQQALRLSLAAA
jgi:hypothetical protein